MFHRIFISLLLLIFLESSLAATEITGAFGIKFGEPLHSLKVLDTLLILRLTSKVSLPPKVAPGAIFLNSSAVKGIFVAQPVMMSELRMTKKDSFIFIAVSLIIFIKLDIG